MKWDNPVSPFRLLAALYGDPLQRSSMPELNCLAPLPSYLLTHWGRVTHICVSELIGIGSDNGLSLGRRQASIWTNAGILIIWPLRTNFSEMLIEIHTFSFTKMHVKMSSTERRSLCLGLNVLTHWPQEMRLLLEICTFRHMFVIGAFPWNCLQVNVTGPHWVQVSIGLIIGLSPSNKRPFPEAMLAR